MRHLIAFVGLCLLAACSVAQQNAALSSAPGQLFCAIQTSGGGAVVVGLVNASVTGLLPLASPLAIIATGATKQFVDDACKRAGGFAVSPPDDTAAAPKVAIVPPPPVTS